MFRQIYIEIQILVGKVMQKSGWGKFHGGLSEFLQINLETPLLVVPLGSAALSFLLAQIFLRRTHVKFNPLLEIEKVRPEFLLWTPSGMFLFEY